MKNDRFVILFTFLTGFSILTGCGPSQSEQAQMKIRLAEAQIAKGDTLDGLIRLDSIKSLFPEAKAEIGKARERSTIINESRIRLLKQKLERINQAVNAWIPQFDAEKGDFEKYVTYVPKRFSIKNSWSRAFILITTTESGELSVTSNYFGDHYINHNYLKLEGVGFSVRTDSVPLGHMNGHQSQFGGSNWERVTYKGKEAELIAKTISDQANNRIKAVLCGKSPYIFYMDDVDKQVLKSVYELSLAFKSRIQLVNEIKATEKRLNSR